MRQAIAHAQLALPDVPIGALVLDEAGEVIATGYNRREADGDPTAHAEIIALRAAGRARGRWHLGGCTLVVTLEPCTMCAGALVLARIDRVVLGAWDPKTGAAGSVRNVTGDGLLNHTVAVTGGVLEEECGAMIRSFFAGRRAERKAQLLGRHREPRETRDEGPREYLGQKLGERPGAEPSGALGGGVSDRAE